MTVRLVDLTDKNIESIYAITENNKKVLLINKNLRPNQIGTIIKEKLVS